MLGTPGEVGAKLRILCRNPDRAGVEVTFPHHHAAGDDERRGREAEFVGAEQGGDDDVTTGLELSVGLETHPPAQSLENERLLRLGETELPRDSRALDRRER